MYNIVTLIGNLVSFNEERVTLELQKPFKNLEGKFETYLIQGYIEPVMFEVFEFVGIGSRVCLKGHLSSAEDGSLSFIVERVITFNSEVDF